MIEAQNEGIGLSPWLVAGSGGSRMAGSPVDRTERLDETLEGKIKQMGAQK